MNSFSVLIFLALVQSAYASLDETDVSKIPGFSRQASQPSCRSVLSDCLKKLDSSEECELLPTPRRSFIPSVPPGTFVLEKLRKGVWMYNDGLYLTLILRQGSRLALADFPDSDNSNIESGTGTLLTDAVDRVLGKTIPTRIDFVYSHAHFDHIGASRRVFNYAKSKFPNARIFIWGTRESTELIERSTSDRAVKPNVIVGKRGRTLSLGSGLKVKLIVVGGHTQEDLVVYIPRVGRRKGIVMYVDVVFPGWVPAFNLAITQDVAEFISAQKEMLKLDWDIIVPGHFKRGTKRDVEENVEYAEDLVASSARALKEVTAQDIEDAGFGKVSDPNAREFGNFYWAIAETTRRLQIDFCYRETIRKWGCRLAGTDVVLRGHCFIAVTHNVVDV